MGMTWNETPSQQGAGYTESPFQFSMPERQQQYEAINQKTQGGWARGLLPYLASMGGSRNPRLQQYVQLAQAAYRYPQGSPQRYEAMQQLAGINPNDIRAALQQTGSWFPYVRAQQFWNSTAPKDWADIGVSTYMANRTRNMGDLSSWGGAPVRFWRGMQGDVNTGIAAQNTYWNQAQSAEGMFPQYRSPAQAVGEFLRGNANMKQLMPSIYGMAMRGLGSPGALSSIGAPPVQKA